MKHFTDIFIKRPVLSSAISLFIFLFGLFSLHSLPLRLFPKIVSPVLTIDTFYPGASSQVMNSYVTSVIQSALSGIEGINYITATSAQNISEITITMQLGCDPQVALSSVMAKVSSVEGQLPHEAEKPSITVSSGDRDPAMILAVTSKQLNRKDVADYLRRAVAPKLEAVDGVSQAEVAGRTDAMRLWLNPVKMAARGITAQDVNLAIQGNNVLTAAGKTNGQETYFTIHATTDIHNVNDFNNVLIKRQNNAYVKLQDIGYAASGDRNSDISAFYNGQSATIIFIKLLPGANPVTVTDHVKALLPDINASLPFDIKMHNVVDNGRYIHQSIHEVIKSLILATLIVTLVIYAFLGSFRAMLIPVITIPLSLMGVCILLQMLNFSMNTLTLLAMVIAIGLVVDDAIVVVENVYRHLENGMSSWDAAMVGAREIAIPVIGMSITLAAVYVPIGLANGLTGQLFKEFALTLSGAVILSGVIALTLVPMLCSKLVNTQLVKQSVLTTIENYLRDVTNQYQRILRRFLPHYKYLIAIWCVIVVATFGMLHHVTKELAPEEDQGLLLAMSSAPDYTNTHFLNSYTNDMMKQFQSISSSDSQVVVAGIPAPHHVLSFISLKEWGDRHESAMQLKSTWQAAVNQVPGIQTMIINPSSLPGDSDLPLQIVLKSTESYETLYQVANQLIGHAWDSGLFEFVQTDLHFDQPALKIEVNRNAATVLGISMQQISDSLSLMLGENQIQQYIKNDQSYFVIPQVESEFRTNPDALYTIHLSTPSGKLVPLSSVAKITAYVEPEHLNQFQKMNSITISGEMREGHSLSEATAFFKQAIQPFSPQVMLDYSGQTRQFLEEGNRMLGIFGLASIVIFILLAIQFESYRSPIIILFGSVPLAIFAASFALLAGFDTLNIYTQIGLLTLVGLISKHGILITDVANKLQQCGFTKFDAIIEAATLRVRPILMTTAAMVLGVVPLIFASGAGSISRNELGRVIASGMLIGTLLTLLLLPAFYLLIAPTLDGKNNESV